MTGPRVGGQWDQALGSQSEIAKLEFEQFMDRRKKLMDEILNAAHAQTMLQQMQQPQQRAQARPQLQGNQSFLESFFQMPSFGSDQPGAPRPAAVDELVAQARFWNIPNPESINPAELQQMIQQRRLEIPRDESRSLGSAVMAELGFTSEGVGATTRLIGNVFGDLNKIPFAGPALSRILRSEEAKRWMYDLSQKTAEFTEGARASQPLGDIGLFDVSAAAGKVAGYALPSVLTWQAIGAAAGAYVPEAWAARVASPMARAALQGGLTGTVLEAGSDETTQSKVFNIGLSAAFGAASVLPKVGLSLGLGTAGAGIGAQVGDTPEERVRHGIEGGIAGIVAGAVPMIAGTSAKVRMNFKSPFDASVENAVRLNPGGGGGGPTGLGRGPVSASARLAQEPGYPAGPDYEVHQEPQLLVRTDPVTSEPIIVEGNMRQSVAAPPEQARLMSPERARRSYIVNGLEDQTIPYQSLTELRGNPMDLPGLRGQLYGLPEAPRAPYQLQGTKVTDPIRGTPLIVYHGTGMDYEAIDPTKLSPESLFGPGFYTTENPEIASGYAGEMRAPVPPGTEIPGPWGTQIGIAPDPGNFPNVKPLRLNIQNPFDIDKTYTITELDQIVSQLKAKVPGYNWSAARNIVGGPENGGWGPPQEMVGEQIYNALTTASTTERIQEVPTGAQQRYWGDVPKPHDIAGKPGLNIALQQIGYDGITHIGGGRTNNAPHRVWIAFRPEQVHSAWDVPDLSMEHAAASADAMTKQATIMESSTLPQAMGKTVMDDLDVVQAARATNPGGVSIIRGIQAPLRIVRAGEPNVTFVERPNGWDALIGQATPQQVDEYTKYGIFTGQKVVTATTGIEAEITGFSRGMVTLKRASGPPLRLRPENVLSSRFAEPQMKAPELWDAFKQDLLSYMNYEAVGAGMSPVTDMNDSRVPSLMAEHMKTFLDGKGIVEPAARQAIDADFNHRWVQDLRELDYEMKALQDELVVAGIEAHNEVEASDSHHIVQSIEESAEKRGFIWISRPENGGVLKDTVNPGAPDVPLSTDEAAREFLSRTDRALPDYTPASDVPLDVAEMVPTDLGREPRLATEDYADNLRSTLDRAHAEDVTEVTGIIAGGGGGVVPPPPSERNWTYDPGGRLPPGRGETLPEQFARMRRSDPSKIHAMEERFKSLLNSHLRYTRYATLNMERMLTEGGVDLGRAWKHYDELATAHDLAAKEGAGWLNEWGDIMREFPRKILRDGTVTRIHEITDTNQRYEAWDALRRVSRYQLSDERVAQAIKADERITDFNHRFFANLVGDPAFGLTMDREIFRYMSHVRARQAQGIADPYHVPNLNPNVEFFAEYAREGNLQFRVMDARELGNHMVRAAMFKKHEAEPWRQLVEAWDDDRVPAPLRQYMMDYARLSRFGYDPRGELAVRGIQSVMGKVFKTPVTMREAQHMLNMPSGAMYMSMLAGRSGIFFRDAIQPLLGLAKVEMPYMATTYAKVLKGAGQRITRQDENVLRDMYQRGLDGGWIQQENPNLEAAGFFEEQPGLKENELLHLTPEEASRREFLANIGDVSAELPAWLVRPSQSRLSTLKWYAKEGQLNRLIVGESAYNQATTRLAEYRRSTVEAVISQDPSKEMTYEKFADKSFFGSFEPPIQRKLQELVQAGDDEGAAQLFAREVANWSQFKYGRKEVPSALRGNVGRYLSMFGSFTGQFMEATNSALANGSNYHKVRFGMTVGAVSAMMYYLKHQTGWSFDKWAWLPNAFQYAGSPFLEMGARAVGAASGLVNVSQGRPASEFEMAAMKEEGTTPFIATAAEFFPYTGYIRSGQEYANALRGTNPLEQAARYTITGDRGSAVDSRRMIEEMTRREGRMPEGTLSPNGGLMPGRPGSGYGYPSSYDYPGGGPVNPQSSLHAPPSLPPDNGVTDPSRVYMKNGYLVYDSPNVSRDGRVPTHRLDAPSGRLPQETWEQYEARVIAAPLETFPPEAFTPINDINQLRPEVKQKVDSMMLSAAQAGHPLMINETFRPIVRQELLFREGRANGDNPITWTLTSDHTTQGAVDFMPVGASGRVKQDGYAWIQANGPKFGFKVLGPSDPGHVALPYGMELGEQTAGAGHPGAGAMP